MCVSLPSLSLKDRKKLRAGDCNQCPAAVTCGGRKKKFLFGPNSLAPPAVTADTNGMHRRYVHTSPGRPCAETLESRRMLAVDVNIDAAQRFQQIDGFGTS